MSAPESAIYSSWSQNDSVCEAYYNVSSSYKNVSPATGYTAILSSSFSVIGSLLIIFTFVAYREVRTVGRAILVFLAIADFLTALGYIFGSALFLHYHPDRYNYSTSENARSPYDNRYVHLCKFQSFVTTFFPISSFLWTANLSIYFFVTIVLRKIQAAKKLIIIFHITAWGIPLLICVPAVATGWLGPAKSHTSVSWCWVRFDTDQPQKISEFYLMELICGKFWEIMTYLVSLILCGIVKYTLYKRKRGYMTEAATKYGYVSIETKMKAAFNHVDQKLLWIPIVFFMVRIWGTLRYFISLMPSCHHVCYRDNNVPDIVTLPPCYNKLYHPLLLYTQSIGDPGQGWSNALLFVIFHRPISERLFPCCCACWDRFLQWFGKIADRLIICQIRQRPVVDRSPPSSTPCTPSNSAGGTSHVDDDHNPLIIKKKSGSKTSYDSVLYYSGSVENEPGSPKVTAMLLPPKDNISINEPMDSAE